jgi:predicted Zn finger-like uncharacterized protein
MSSVIQLNCPSCQSTLMVALVLAGTEVKCPKCEMVFIPHADPASVAEAHEMEIHDDLAAPHDAPSSAEFARRPRPREQGIGFRCPFCQSTYPPEVKRRISTAGWITFAVLLLACFPLSLIGLFIKEDYRVCSSCRIKLG